jgi:hypothetical protein
MAVRTDGVQRSISEPIVAICDFLQFLEQVVAPGVFLERRLQ